MPARKTPSQVPPELLAEPLVLADQDIVSVPEDDVINGVPVFPEIEPGKVIDNEVVEDVPLIREDKPKKPSPKAGAPNLDEWLDFFSRIVLRFGTDWYISFAFRGIDENVISDKDLQRIRLKPEERDRIAIPFAEYANKSPWARKHGRLIVSTADSFESLVTLGMWFSRVNRVANKYRPKAPKRGNENVNPGKNVQNGTGTNSAEFRSITIIPGAGG